MAEEVPPTPQPPIPKPCITADLVIKTMWEYRRCRLYYLPTAMPDDEEALSGIATQIFGSFAPVITPLMPTVHLFQRVECKYYGSSNVGFFANSTNTAVEGAIETPDTKAADAAALEGTSEDVLPDESCLILQKKTGKLGRANQGRLFFAGLSEEINYAGEVAEAYIAEAKALANLLPTTIAVSDDNYTGDLQARHWNRKENILVPITKAYVVNAIGTRKDRRRPVPMERL